MLKSRIIKYEEVIMLGKVFKKNGLNLVYGPSGVGKTISSIKALNAEDIEPVLVDFDNNNSPEFNNCNYKHINGIDVIDRIRSKDYVEIIKDSVIVIDTWQLFLTNVGSAKKAIEFLYLLVDNNNTVIVIAHNKDIATKTDIPDIDSKYVNHMDSKLFLEYDKGNSSKTNPRPEGYNLTVLKLRGYNGPRTIYNWMR